MSHDYSYISYVYNAGGAGDVYGRVELYSVEIDMLHNDVCDIAVVMYLNLRWPCATAAIKSSNHTTFDSIDIAKRISAVHRLIWASYT